MSNRKLKFITQTYNGFKLFTRRNALLAIGIFFVLVLAAGFTVHRFLVVHAQEQRFSQVKAVLADFKNNMNRSLGANITSMHEVDSCNYPNSPEIILPFESSNGSLTCGMNIIGTVRAQSSDAMAEALQIDTIARAALQKSGINISTDSTIPSVRNYGTNGSVVVADTYYLYGHGAASSAMRCDVKADTPFSPDNVNGPNYKVKSLEFTFDCFQGASKKFFQVTK